MRPLSNHLNDVFERLDGRKAYAFLSSGRLTPSSSDTNPYRVLVVRTPCPFQVGDVVKAPGDAWMLLLEHPSDSPTDHAFRAAFINHTYEWERPTTEIDPISQMEKSTGLQSLGTLYCNFDSPTDRTFAGFTLQQYEFLTGQAVLVGDVVGGKTVKTVSDLFGVKLVHAE